MSTFITDTIPDHTSGTTFPGRGYHVTVNGSLPSLNSSAIVMTIGSYTLSTTNEKIEILGDGRFQIKEQIISFLPKKYKYSIKIIFSSGVEKVYIKGTWRILP